MYFSSFLLLATHIEGGSPWTAWLGANLSSQRGILQ